ncbi:MAG: hypothetical protein VB131_01230 [Burkholderia gladioli]
MKPHTTEYRKNTMPESFLVAGLDGKKTLEAVQLATFAREIDGKRFRFVVTYRPRAGNEISLTHRDCGKRVCGIPHIAIQAALDDYGVAGRGELDKLIARVGAARVRSVLLGE